MLLINGAAARPEKQGYVVGVEEKRKVRPLSKWMVAWPAPARRVVATKPASLGTRDALSVDDGSTAVLFEANIIVGTRSFPPNILVARSRF